MCLEHFADARYDKEYPKNETDDLGVGLFEGHITDLVGEYLCNICLMDDFCNKSGKFLSNYPQILTQRTISHLIMEGGADDVGSKLGHADTPTGKRIEYRVRLSV